MIFPTLADLKCQAKLPQRRQRTINQSNLSRNNVLTNRITEISTEKAQNMRKRCQMPNSNVCARVSNIRKRGVHFSTLSSVYERALRRPTSQVRTQESCWGSETCRDIVFFFQNMRNLRKVFLIFLFLV